jgi:hypothetical protein
MEKLICSGYNKCNMQTCMHINIHDQSNMCNARWCTWADDYVVCEEMEK